MNLQLNNSGFQQSTKRQDLIIIFGIILVALAIALLINILLSTDWELIPSVFSKKEWFVFWATYTTGILSLIIGCLAIVHANNNSKKAILQQNSIIIRQKSEEILKDITEEIKRQNSLLNIVRFTSSILCVKEEDLPAAREEVLNNKSSIAERQIQWAIIRNLYLTSEYVTSVTEEYNKVWNDAVCTLEAYIRYEMELFQSIEEEKIAGDNLRLLDELLNRLYKQLITDTADEQRISKVSELEKQKLENIQKQFEARQKLKNNVQNLQSYIPLLSKKQDVVFSASIRFLSTLSNVMFVDNIKKAF